MGYTFTLNNINSGQRGRWFSEHEYIMSGHIFIICYVTILSKFSLKKVTQIYICQIKVYQENMEISSVSRINSFIMSSKTFDCYLIVWIVQTICWKTKFNFYSIRMHYESFDRNNVICVFFIHISVEDWTSYVRFSTNHKSFKLSDKLKISFLLISTLIFLFISSPHQNIKLNCLKKTLWAIGGYHTWLWKQFFRKKNGLQLITMRRKYNFNANLFKILSRFSVISS